MKDRIADDAELLELGHLIEAARAIADDDGRNEDERSSSVAQVSDIAKQILAIAPTTLPGLIVKARARWWDIGFSEAMEDCLLPDADERWDTREYWGTDEYVLLFDAFLRAIMAMIEKRDRLIWSLHREERTQEAIGAALEVPQRTVADVVSRVSGKRNAAQTAKPQRPAPPKLEWPDLCWQTAEPAAPVHSHRRQKPKHRRPSRSTWGRTCHPGRDPLAAMKFPNVKFLSVGHFGGHAILGAKIALCLGAGPNG